MTTDDDPGWVDRSRMADLADAGLPGYGVGVVVTSSGEERFVLLKYNIGETDYCAAVTIGADGAEHLALLRYNAGETDYWPLDWSVIEPHELIGLPVYWKD